jgi:lipoate-protein ligase A
VENLRVIKIDTKNIFYNLAIEENLLNHYGGEKSMLLLWQSQNVVVIGKHQNPWKECNMEVAIKKNITIARRNSGGGTVFHDQGNLNFSIITPRSLFSHHRNVSFLLRAMEYLKLGVSLVDNSGGLFLHDKKISGSAFYFKKDRVLHHGTLLINTDLHLLRQVCTPDLKGVHDTAVPSRPSPVINLADLIPGLTIAEVAGVLKKGFEKHFPGNQEEPLYWKEDEISEISKRYSSKEWIFGFPREFELNNSSSNMNAGKINTLEFTEQFFSENCIQGRTHD